MAGGIRERYRSRMKVHEVMTAHARCVSPDNTLVEAAGLMKTLDVGSLPICENDRLVGMLTDRDIVVRCVASACDPETTAAREAMSPGILYVFADQSLEEASDVMEKKQVRRLAVLNRQKRLVGVISLGDIAIASNPAFSGSALRDISEPAHPDGRQRRLMRNSEPTMVAASIRSNPQRERSTTRGRTRTSAGASTRGSGGRTSRAKGGRTAQTRTRSRQGRRGKSTAARSTRRATASRR
jgi:CBS domain-containing protein